MSQPPTAPDRTPPPEGGDSARLPRPASDRLWRARTVFLACLTALTFLLLPLKYGFPLTPSLTGVFEWALVAAAVLFGADLLLRLAFAPDRRAFAAEHKGDVAVLGMFSLALVVLPLSSGVDALDTDAPWFLAVDFYLVLNILLRIITLERFLLSLNVRPVQVFVLSFAVIILLGTAALALLPNATAPPGGIGLVDALFTATSATCVTGLVVHDTGSFFTPFGQAILLVLMQLGGLGIMTFAAFFALAAGRRMSLGENFVIKSALNVEVVGTVRRFLVSIFLFTFLLESAGALLLFLTGAGRGHPAGELWFSVFHAVSAFCNAGFCLNAEGFVPYGGAAGFQAVVMALIVVGGLGFIVLLDLLQTYLYPLLGLRRFALFPGSHASKPSQRLSVHTRIVLLATGSLLVAGALLFAAVEWNGVLDGRPAGERALGALFQSVTARTAGFHTVDTGAIAGPGMVLVLFLMFIGASPGSTGGGIKTSTFAVLLLSVWSLFRGRASTEVFKRRLPREVVSKCVVIVLCALLLLFAGTFLLSAVEPGRPLRRVAFEVVSAFATVGLSTGITPDLSPAGKVILIVVMFAGRLGPLTLVLSLATRERQTLYAYPEESVMIG